MSFLDRIAFCQDWNRTDYLPFFCGEERIGFLSQALVKRLRDFPELVALNGEGVHGEGVHVAPTLKTFEARSAAFAKVMPILSAEGLIGPLRGEDYGVTNRWGAPPLFKIDRRAVPELGLRAYGVHLNGVVQKQDGLYLWVGKRAQNKPTGPGKLDHLVAGGQPYGLGIFDNLVKEAAEEAGMTESLARQALPVSLVSYRCRFTDGLRDDICFCYDITLPEDFTPHNTDGEVDWFQLWRVEEVMARLRDTEDFKFNVALVIIDFLVRWGFIAPDDPDYQAIVEGLRLRD